jgi:hypothetical protein
MAIFSLFARGRALSSGSQPPASPTSSTASSAVTARDADDAVSVDSGFFSDADDDFESADEGDPAASGAEGEWPAGLDASQPPDGAAHAGQAAEDQAADDHAAAALPHAADVRAAAAAQAPSTAAPVIGRDAEWTSEPHGSRPDAASANEPAVQAAADDAVDAPRLATLSVFTHNATSFACIACAYSAPQLADLRVHRHRRHRGTTFTDVFHGGCACAASFV